MDPIDNGMITYSPDADPNFPLTTMATYSCSKGYYLEVNATNIEVRVCQDDNGKDYTGVWSGSAPTCIRELHTLMLCNNYTK